MGENIAKYIFRSRVSMFELLAFAVAMSFFDGFWPVFLVSLAAGAFTGLMQHVLGVD